MNLAIKCRENCSDRLRIVSERVCIEIPDKRSLTPAELDLVRWMLLHGHETASRFLPQLDRLSVDSRCSCGCGSINFAVDGVIAPHGALGVLGDYEYRSADGYLCGAFVFERHGLLAGLELWSIDGKSTPSQIPSADDLHPLGATS
jgi:hypothetical protein